MAVKFNHWCKVSLKPLAQTSEGEKRLPELTKAQKLMIELDKMQSEQSALDLKLA